jgi:hypothetical protein
LRAPITSSRKAEESIAVGAVVGEEFVRAPEPEDWRGVEDEPVLDVSTVLVLADEFETKASEFPPIAAITVKKTISMNPTPTIKSKCVRRLGKLFMAFEKKSIADAEFAAYFLPCRSLIFELNVCYFSFASEIFIKNQVPASGQSRRSLKRLITHR